MIRTLLLTVLLAAAASAQTKPNFTGAWKLSVAKSEFGPLPGPESRSDVIEQTESGIRDKVSAVNTQGKLDYTLAFKTDGTETVNKVGEREVKVTGAWAGSTLAVTTRLTFQDNEIVFKANWTLSADGVTLTQAVHVTSAMGEADQKMVYEKQ